uniref:Glycosyltransferase n=1 Tax=Ignavibacterium album TaxID=591197 RepID=A0A832G832_9BACT
MYSAYKNTFAPIALFVYKRPNHLKLTIEALIKNYLIEESELFIFSDGPKSDKDEIQVNEVRKFIKELKGFKKIFLIERETNFGLSKSIISGVTELVDKYGKIIVLEDDLVTSPFFVKYMNDALTYYNNIDEVISIHGYMYPLNAILPETFFLRGADCWGWGTWKRAWNLFEPDGKKLLRELEEQNLLSKFDWEGALTNVRMLKNFIKGKNDSWAIRWHASAFLNNKLTLYPGKSLINNIGTDGLGTNVRKTNIYNTTLTSEQIEIKSIPLEENLYVRELLKIYFLSNKPLLSKLLNKII